MRDSNTKIYFRVLPMLKTCWKDIKILDDRKTFYLRCLQDFQKGRGHLEPTFWKFKTDGIFYNLPQSIVYDHVMTNDLLYKIVEGNNAAIISYGQTGSGKSVTTGGLDNTYEDRGLIPRTIEEFFKIKEKSRQKICIQISYVEISRIYAYDLLKDDGVLLDMNSLKHVSLVKVKTPEEALALIFSAEAKKSCFHTKTYRSHRANSVITFSITTKATTLYSSSIGKLHIVDLSGCDTVGNISCLHKHGFDIGIGNLAKTQLEQFILILMEGLTNQSVAKQRMCLIVNYLKDTLNQHSLLRFIGHIQTPMEYLMITISMLRFGQLVKALKPTKLHPRVFIDAESKSILLQEELNKMKNDRDLNSIINNQDLSTNLSNDRKLYMSQMAQDYLQNKTDELVILTSSDTILALKLFKNLYNNIEAEKMTYMDKLKSLDETQISKNSLLKTREGGSVLSTRVMRKTKGSIKSNRSVASIKRNFGSKIKDSKIDTVSVFDKKETKATKQISAKNLRRASRKRSSVSSDLLTNTDNTLTDEGRANLPNEVPEFANAWDSFKTDPDYKYTDLSDEVNTSEKNILDCNLKYIREVKNLQELNECCEVRKEDLSKAEFLRDLDSVPNESASSLTELETKCHEKLKQIQSVVVVKKEELLKLQTDLKLAIEDAKYAKTTLDKQFQQYCRTKFKTLVPNLEQVGETSQCTDQLEKFASNEEILNSATNLDETRIVLFEQLNKMMKKEHEERLKSHKRKRKWIQSLKLTEM